MANQVTLSVRSLIIAVVVALALVAAYLAGVVVHGPAAAAAAPAAAGSPTQPRTIRMTGSGEVTGVPDQLSFHLTITRTATDVAAAMDSTSAVMTRVLAALGGQGVERKDTRSTGLSVDPVYHYSSYAPPLITGYQVRQSADVLVRDIRMSGEAITAAVHTGGNAVRVSGIQLHIGDVDALMARARTEAVRDATAKAQQYAGATGQQLGDVLSLRETRTGGRVPQPQALASYRASALDGVAAVPVRVGRQQLKVTVGIVWQFR